MKPLVTGKGETVQNLKLKLNFNFNLLTKHRDVNCEQVIAGDWTGENSTKHGKTM